MYQMNGIEVLCVTGDSSNKHH